jgi:predicted DNA-binding transcriptional regulator AlpA
MNAGTWTLKDLRTFFQLSPSSMDKLRVAEGFPRPITPPGMHPRYSKSAIVRWAETRDDDKKDQS